MAATPPPGTPPVLPPRTFHTLDAYPRRSVEFTYRGRFFIVSPKAPAPPPKPRPNVPVATFELLLAVAGVVVDKWDKIATWTLAAFAAVAGLVVSNHDKVTALMGERTVRLLLWLLLATVLLHVAQKVTATFVQAMDAGHKAGKAMALDPMHPEDAAALMAGMLAAYPRLPARLLAHLFRRIGAVGLAPMSKLLMRMAFIATGCAAGQLLLGVVAVAAVAVALY